MIKSLAEELNLSEDQANYLASEINNALTPTDLFLQRLLEIGNDDAAAAEVKECKQGLDKVFQLMREIKAKKK